MEEKPQTLERESAVSASRASDVSSQTSEEDQADTEGQDRAFETRRERTDSPPDEKTSNQHRFNVAHQHALITTDQELGDILSLMDNMEEEYLKPLESPLTPFYGMPGVLRYKRESQHQAPDPRSVKPEQQSLRDPPVLCEFCGVKARPPLNSVYTEDPEEFCCPQYQNLFEIVDQEKRLFWDRPDELLGGSAQTEDFSTSEEEELKARAQEREEQRQQLREMERYYQEAHTAQRTTLSPAETQVPHTKTISFQLSSSAPREGGWTTTQHPGIEEDFGKGDGDFLIGPGSLGFGMSHQKDCARFMEKYYSDGSKFLTVFPDGSAQVFYPSGHLALLILTSGRERVCIVQDDHTPDPPIRATFQSNGQSTCYHGNGNIWLNMDVWGGQCLEDGGARTRRWCWSDHAHTPTPLRPVFLSLNRSVGVRVLGRDRVFLSFLASGQQARFSVGTCLQPVNPGTPPPGPPISKEELFLLAGRVGVHLALVRLQLCRRFPSSPKPLGIKPPPHLLSLARKLLTLSCRLPVEGRERAFIHSCLQDCLGPLTS